MLAYSSQILNHQMSLRRENLLGWGASLVGAGHDDYVDRRPLRGKRPWRIDCGLDLNHPRKLTRHGRLFCN